MRSCSRFFISATRRRAAAVQARAGIGSATLFRVARTPYFARGKLDEIWVGGFPGVETGFDAAHVVDIFHRAFFAGGDDQALLTLLSGTLVGNSTVVPELSAPPVCTSMNVRRQLFLQKWQRVSSLRVVRYWILRTASRPMNVVCVPIAPQAHGFDGGADGARFAAVLVDDDLRLLARRRGSWRG